MTKTTSLGNGDERREKLMKILRSRPDDEACRLCLDNLGEYVASQLAGEDYLSRFATIATHLDSCPECASAYARIYDLELAEISGQWLWPDYIPDPDLSFLKRQSALSWTDLLQQKIQRWSEGVSLQLTAELLQLLRPPLPASQLRQSSTVHDRYGELLLKLPPDPTQALDLPVSIAAFKDKQNPETCLVEVIVEPPGRSWPDLGGSIVTLRIGAEEKVAETDHNGLATFTTIPINRLEILEVNVTFAV